MPSLADDDSPRDARRGHRPAVGRTPRRRTSRRWPCAANDFAPRQRSAVRHGGGYGGCGGYGGYEGYGRGGCWAGERRRKAIRLRRRAGDQAEEAEEKASGLALEVRGRTEEARGREGTGGGGIRVGERAGEQARR